MMLILSYLNFFLSDASLMLLFAATSCVQQVANITRQADWCIPYRINGCDREENYKNLKEEFASRVHIL
jgi:hypothetical protein